MNHDRHGIRRICNTDRFLSPHNTIFRCVNLLLSLLSVCQLSGTVWCHVILPSARILLSCFAEIYRSAPPAISRAGEASGPLYLNRMVGSIREQSCQRQKTNITLSTSKHVVWRDKAVCSEYVLLLATYCSLQLPRLVRIPSCRWQLQSPKASPYPHRLVEFVVQASR